MNKLAALAGVAVSTFCLSAIAQEAPPYENWVGGFVSYYNADNEKPAPTGGLDDGKGFGAELGFRFDPSWAVRFQLGRVIIGKDNNNPLALADDGTQIGADVLYFLENDAAYLFTGLREQSIRDSYRMASVGIGKHWEVADNWRVITEVASHYDFGQGYDEFSAKLGLAYIFGKNTASTQQADTDNDGVYNAVDRCPATPQGVAVDATGCNVDLDSDGVVNNADQCPMTPKGAKVDATGCEIKSKDSDNDGVMDSNDKCVNTPTSDKVDTTGCSIFEQSEIAVGLDMLFANNSSVISNPDAEKINEFVDFMRRYPNTEAIIEGHTSAVGEVEYNQYLSEKRANAVKTLLINNYGIDADRLTAIGYGETRLKFNDNTEQAHRLNRRIEAKVTAVIKTKALR